MTLIEMGNFLNHKMRWKATAPKIVFSREVYGTGLGVGIYKEFSQINNESISQMGLRTKGEGHTKTL